MIGNAVPVNLAKFVAEGILQYIKSGKQSKRETLFDMDTFEIPLRALHMER